MTDEHYQDGIKLPSDKDKPKWELYATTKDGHIKLERIKVDCGYIYRADEVLMFVPINPNVSREELTDKVADLSLKLNKMQDSLQEFFEEDKVDKIEDWAINYFASTDRRINKLEEHHTRQIDENRKVSKILDNFDEFCNNHDERIEKLESTFKHIDEKNIDAVWGALNERIQKLEEQHARQIDENRKISKIFDNYAEYTNERVEKLESLSHKHSGGYCPTEKQECQHPRETLKLCPHGLPLVINAKGSGCTACY
jgi:hypothetical protein